ncbi:MULTISPECIES: biotin--[acetyl-CoA-carboxylase] ligase [unclassified Thauera]|uniref:biotin--[acetyl-CoA-carboxylase] ligase n=1 Tax=unclassified Thauera TaxID=2609274 RepID=UPI0002D1083C|nr:MULTISPECIES: biotin--[acetyl-CoA-carboxylase] ligase [unclassified Thauera]ENO91751.1 biotin/acetyl-CoA-carboxylase ligase [Thauera sp. 28]WBL64927.1 biotin--[acetyl-CoA-carboxylase] ligase [Thauera sp. WB-2]HAG74114.1 biotin--[acetyl-CoA-carboxylase] ligase [Thauera sp.]HAY10699.1 biotin--[acetyl-CoA-carboxylase] ligase [Thauera sp.]HNR61204.1 biotin--[acetyl-CoA-carboxylase] ligase [Thauera sp.]
MPDASPASREIEARRALEHRLGRLADSFVIDWRAHCTSTNSALIEATPADDGFIHVLIADRQSAGRGRRGRQWLSWDDGSLTFSALWRFAPGAPVPAGLSLVAGLALARALEELGAQGVQLKWPNDVLIHGDKLAGILVELLPGRGRTPAAVIGIGINLQLPADAQVPEQRGVTDLAHALDTAPPTRATVLAAVLAELRSLLDTYAAAGFVALRDAWQQRNAFADLPVCISGEAETLQGICRGVDEDGALLLETAVGMRRVLVGDVSLRAGGGGQA